MYKRLLVIVFCSCGGFLCPGTDTALPVDQVIQMYVTAAGGQAAIDRITTRQLEAGSRHGSKVSMSWQAPNKVLRVKRKEKEGFDGSVAWLQTKRKKIEKLPRSTQEEMETDANPIRYVHLRQLYTELASAPREMVDGSPMDVLISPNHIGQTKFYFDASSHLLMRIDELGVTSAYFKHTTEFSEYKEYEGIKLPTRIARESQEPGAENGDLRLSKIKQNVDLDARIFERPNIAAVVSGGKR